MPERKELSGSSWLAKTRERNKTQNTPSLQEPIVLKLLRGMDLICAKTFSGSYESQPLKKKTHNGTRSLPDWT
jgi:hypothetical protein